MEYIDGKALAREIRAGLRAEVRAMEVSPRLAIVVVGDDAVIANFIAQKKKAAKAAGIDVRIYPFSETISTKELRKRIAEIVHEERNNGVIIQLPLPKQINARYILDAVTPEKDVDVLSARAVGNFAVGKSAVLPPVVGAVRALLEKANVDYAKQSVAILGAGKLVGRPVAVWLVQEGATVSVVQRSAKNPADLLRKADIIISGIGAPGFIKKDMIKEGAILIDAGTSESGGQIVGDVDEASVRDKASLLTPVPGGVGPVTVAMLLQNLVTLARAKI